MPPWKTVGVVIARFQTHLLTDPHQHLLRTAAGGSDRLIILIGCDPFPRKREPLEYALRARMVHDWCEAALPGQDFAIMPLLNRPSNQEWALQVDNLVDAVSLGGPVTLYCGPDGAGPIYRDSGGRFKVETIDSFGLHATGVRAALLPRHTEDFRAGCVYATERRFVNPFLAIDVLPLSWTGEKMALGRKVDDPNGHWRLVGGFVDPGETLEQAVIREAHEEMGITIERTHYCGSALIQDWRYLEGPENIISAVFIARCAEYSPAPKPHDDLAEADWFPSSPAANQPTYGSPLFRIAPVHAAIFEMAFAQRSRVLEPTPAHG